MCFWGLVPWAYELLRNYLHKVPQWGSPTVPEGQLLALAHQSLFQCPKKEKALGHRLGAVWGANLESRAEVDEVVGAQAAAVGSTLGAPKELLPREVRPSLVDLAHSLWFKLSEHVFPSSPQAVKYLDVLPYGCFASFTGGAPSYLVLKRAFSAGEWCGLLMGKISKRK